MPRISNWNDLLHHLALRMRRGALASANPRVLARAARTLLDEAYLGLLDDDPALANAVADAVDILDDAFSGADGGG